MNHRLKSVPQFGGLGGIQTLTRSLQDFYAVDYITSPKLWWLWVELNHQPRAYETLALFHLSYTAEVILEARGGVEPRAFPPSSRRFGLEDRCRERGPELEAMVRFELTHCCLRNSRSSKLELHRQMLAGA